LGQHEGVDATAFGQPFWEHISPIPTVNPEQCPPYWAQSGSPQVQSEHWPALGTGRHALGGSQRGAPYVYDLLIRSADQTCAILQRRSCGSGVYGAAAADPSRAGATACPTMTAAGGPPCARSCSAASRASLSPRSSVTGRSRAAHSCSAHARDAGAAVAAEPGATDPSGTTTPS